MLQQLMLIFSAAAMKTRCDGQAMRCGCDRITSPPCARPVRVTCWQVELKKHGSASKRCADLIPLCACRISLCCYLFGGHKISPDGQMRCIQRDCRIDCRLLAISGVLPAIV